MACDGNATVLSLDTAGGQITSTNSGGRGAEVEAYDAGAHRFYVVAESERRGKLSEQPPVSWGRVASRGPSLRELLRERGKQV